MYPPGGEARIIGRPPRRTPSLKQKAFRKPLQTLLMIINYLGRRLFQFHFVADFLD
jgi:hypothetical protein